MKCPNCNGNLVDTKAGLYCASNCTQCGGLWINGKEIDRILSNETFTSLEGTPVYLEGSKEPCRTKNCPSEKCNNVKLRAMSIRGVELDVCDNCKGVYFDKDELINIFPDGFDKSKGSDVSIVGIVELANQYFVALISGGS